MPPVRNVVIGDDERTRWQLCGGQMLEALLRSGAVAVLDAAWLVSLSERGGLLRRRQELPDEAFLCLDEVRAPGGWGRVLAGGRAAIDRRGSCPLALRAVPLPAVSSSPSVLRASC